jgi:D-threonate/D-erythronate kinase
MIRVVADDLTGAAELAGICKSHDLHTALTLVPVGEKFADALVYCTDSRSMTLPDALSTSKRFLEPIATDEESWFYKKTDSVLRGHVVEELLQQMACMGTRRVVFIPQNPSMGRVIDKGLYFVDGRLLSETAFAYDPEFPQQTADVAAMLAGRGAEIHLRRAGDVLPDTGIIVGEASSPEDLRRWALVALQEKLLAGGGDFFQALMQQRFGLPSPTVVPPPGQPFLYISGTGFQPSLSFIQTLADECGFVHWIDPAVLEGVGMADWLCNCTSTLHAGKKAIVAFHPSLQGQKMYTALFLRKKMASIINALLPTSAVEEVLIEGGSSAKVILDELDQPYWIPDAVYGRGVVRMKDAHKRFAVTLKPGSYPLPDAIASIFVTTNH